MGVRLSCLYVQLGTVSELLSKRRQQDSPLSQQEEAALK